MAKKKVSQKKAKTESTVSLERFFDSVGPQREKTVIEHAQAIIQTAAANGRDMLKIRDKMNLGEAPKRTKKTPRKGGKGDKAIEKLFEDFSSGMSTAGRKGKGKGKKKAPEVEDMNAQLRKLKKLEALERAEANRYN